ncbi:MAG: molybdopterin molybdotransferase MoeA [Gammaproteobacteria bacterium]|nr:molybdopterin molybdotransferase MoeA [Gammaproteobacteria bacterium]
MLSLEQAQAAIRDRITRATRSQTLALSDAVGRTLARARVAVVDNPAFDNSAMDGYAYNAADMASTQGRLPVQGESRCGNAPGMLTPGTTMRIFTGAPIPKGADSIAIQEVVQVADNVAVFPAAAKNEDFIRRRGEDFRSGEVLYPLGHRITPMDIALLAAAGVSQVEVFAKPTVLVVATGDELVPPGTPLQAGQIYESNRAATIAQLSLLGAEVIDGGIVKDNPETLHSVLAAASNYDFVITSGGASVGDHDVVKQVFAQLGSIEFWRVKIKPGKPLAFGRVGDKTHFFALPGNPVSSLITFKLFVEPALKTWHHGVWTWLELTATTENDFRRSPGRMEFLRGRLRTQDGRLYAHALPGQGSHMLGTLRLTNGLIKIGEESLGFKAGDSVTVVPMTLELS